MKEAIASASREFSKYTTQLTTAIMGECVGMLVSCPVVRSYSKGTCVVHVFCWANVWVVGGGVMPWLVSLLSAFMAG